jgi:hypothetical protein
MQNVKSRGNLWNAKIVNWSNLTQAKGQWSFRRIVPMDLQVTQQDEEILTDWQDIYSVKLINERDDV